MQKKKLFLIILILLFLFKPLPTYAAYCIDDYDCSTNDACGFGVCGLGFGDADSECIYFGNLGCGSSGGGSGSGGECTSCYDPVGDMVHNSDLYCPEEIYGAYVPDTNGDGTCDAIQGTPPAHIQFTVKDGCTGGAPAGEAMVYANPGDSGMTSGHVVTLDVQPNTIISWASTMSGYDTVSGNRDSGPSGSVWTEDIVQTRNCSGGTPPPSCSDGVQNQNETGVDTGGVCGGGNISCMQANSAVRGGGSCGGSVFQTSSQGSSSACQSWCNSQGAVDCEWNGSTCYAESATGCHMQTGVTGWYAGVSGQSCSTPPPPPPNNNAIGYQDLANCSYTAGWAFDPDASASSIDVHFYKDGPAGAGGTFVGYVNANDSRPDVNAAYGITGSHGFSWTIPNSLKDGAPHTIYVHAIDATGGANNVISGSPKTIQCAIPPPTNLILSCPAGGTPVSASWTLPAGYTKSYFRSAVGTNSPGPVIYAVPESTGGVDNGPSASFTSSPGQIYHVWVHTRDPNTGLYSSYIEDNVSCGFPPPTNLILSCPDPGTTLSAYWTLPNGYSNSYFRASLGANNFGAPVVHMVPEWTSDTGPSTSFTSTPGQIYHAWVHARDASTGLYSGYIDKNITCGPPPPTNLTLSCPAPGTTLTASWALPAGYTKSYFRAAVGTNSPGPVIYAVPESTGGVDNGPSASFTTTSGQTYHVWVHTRDPNTALPGGYGDWSAAIENNITCASAPAMSGVLNNQTSSCTIASGASNCPINFTWSTTNPVATSAVTTNLPTAGTQVGTGNNQATQTPFAVRAPSQTFYLYNNGVLLDQKTVTSTCASGTSWNGTSCAAAGTASITATQTTIFTGDSTTLTWSSNAASCTGTNFSTGNSPSGQFIATPGSTTTYSVTCNGITSSVTITVKKKPTFIEN